MKRKSLEEDKLLIQSTQNTQGAESTQPSQDHEVKTRIKYSRPVNILAYTCKFFYINLDFFIQPYQGNKSILQKMMHIINDGLFIKNEPKCTFAIFQKAVLSSNNNAIILLVNLLKKYPDFVKDLYQFLNTNKNIVNKAIEDWYLNKNIQRKYRQKRIEQSPIIQLTLDRFIKKVINILYINVEFFYSPFLGDDFKHWVESDLKRKAIMENFSKKIYASLESNEPAVNIYKPAILEFQQALKYLFHSQLNPVLNFLLKNDDFTCHMIIFAENKEFQQCIEDWYQLHPPILQIRASKMAQLEKRKAQIHQFFYNNQPREIPEANLVPHREVPMTKSPNI